MTAIKNLKSVSYLKETTFCEAYDNSATFLEIKVSEFALEKMGEKLETKYLNKDRELNNTTATGRKTGKMTFKKNWDKALIAKHPELLKALGTVTTGTAGTAISAKNVVSEQTVITSTGHGLVAGDLVWVFDTNGKSVIPVNIVDSVNLDDVTLKFPVPTRFYDLINTSGDKIAKPTTIKPSRPDYGTTYQFVAEYSDNTVEVLRGCGAQIQFELASSGKIEVSFEIMGAIAENKDEDTKVLHSAPSSTPTAEGNYQPVYIDLDSYYMYDSATDTDPYENNPQDLKLNFGHTLKPHIHMGGYNNITGYYTEPSITCEGMYDRTSTNLSIFDKDNETDSSQYMFISQRDFAFYAPLARYTNDDTDYVNEFDAIKVNVDVNFDTVAEPILVLPQ